MGQNARLFCKFFGNPSPEIIWYRNNQFIPIKNNSKYYLETIDKYVLFSF